MATEPSKYAENQFEVATRNRFPLMSEVLADTVPRAAAATAGNATAFSTVLSALTFAANAWNAGETTLANALAAQLGSTLALDDKLASLTRKPDADTSSLLEQWDTTIRGQVAYQGPTYVVLLPHGRDTVTTGSVDQQLDALRDLGVRLTAQAAKPALVTLGGVVTTFATAARSLRTAQITAKGNLDAARAAQEPRRLAAAAALYALVGQGMVVWSTTPELVDTLFDVNLLRRTVQDVPAAPATTVWDPAARTLSTATMPAGGSRLEAWRTAPGGMPERLAVGDPGAVSILIPATITFIPGGLYQLWLVAVNSRGSSPDGPVQNWTAV